MSEWVIPSLAEVLCGDWVTDRDWERVEPSSEVSSCSPSAGRVGRGPGGGLWGLDERIVAGCRVEVEGRQQGWVGWEVGGIWDEGSGGSEGVGWGGGQISGNTHMLESGHAQLFFNKIYKILVCRSPSYQIAINPPRPQAWVAKHTL